jgi:hypothetical protein
MADRRKPSTMTIRVKLVMSIMIDGARESSVMAKTIWIAVETFPCSVGAPLSPIVMLNGKPGVGDAIGAAEGAMGAPGDAMGTAEGATGAISDAKAGDATGASGD